VVKTQSQFMRKIVVFAFVKVLYPFVRGYFVGRQIAGLCNLMDSHRVSYLYEPWSVNFVKKKKEIYIPNTHFTSFSIQKIVIIDSYFIFLCISQSNNIIFFIAERDVQRTLCTRCHRIISSIK
jgi:hypothetical protein